MIQLSFLKNCLKLKRLNGLYRTDFEPLDNYWGIVSNLLENAERAVLERDTNKMKHVYTAAFSLTQLRQNTS